MQTHKYDEAIFFSRDKGDIPFVKRTVIGATKQQWFKAHVSDLNATSQPTPHHLLGWWPALPQSQTLLLPHPPPPFHHQRLSQPLPFLQLFRLTPSSLNHLQISAWHHLYWLQHCHYD